MIIKIENREIEPPRAIYNYEFDAKISEIEEKLQTLNDRIDNLNECLSIIMRRLQNGN